MLKNVIWLWTNSTAVWEGKGLVAQTQRIRFFVRALANYSAIKPLIEAPRETSLGRMMESRPEMVGAVIWPYQCAGWDARTRLARICEHYALVDRIGAPLEIPVDGQFMLLDLNDIREGLKVIVDQPKWFMREGGLSINLFVANTRMFSLAFSLSKQDDQLVAFIGAIQGRDIEGALDEYRELTKAAHGMRPRDLLIELFRTFCTTVGVTKIFAVSDEYRHHRHSYFGKAQKKFSNAYNEIWTERGGIRVDPMFFELPIDMPLRDLNAIAAKKRGMYRRRYEMLQSLRRQTIDNYQSSSLSSV